MNLEFIMSYIELDDLDIDYLAKLQRDIDDFLNAYDTYQAMWESSESDYIAAKLLANDYFNAVRSRIRNLAIDYGIHRQLLDEFAAYRQLTAQSKIP